MKLWIQNQYIIHCVIVTGNDLNQVMCLLCGSSPKIVNSDGNAKESQNLSVGNFIFDNNCLRVNFGSIILVPCSYPRSY